MTAFANYVYTIQGPRWPWQDRMFCWRRSCFPKKPQGPTQAQASSVTLCSGRDMSWLQDSPLSFPGPSSWGSLCTAIWLLANGELVLPPPVPDGSEKDQQEEGGWESSWEAKLSAIWKAYPGTLRRHTCLAYMALALSRLTVSRGRGWGWRFPVLSYLGLWTSQGGWGHIKLDFDKERQS